MDHKIKVALADGIYNTMLCHHVPEGAGYWPGEYADRDREVVNQRLTAGLYRVVSDKN